MIFNSLTEGITTEIGQSESKRERSEKKLRDTSLVYGDIGPEAISSVFKWIQRTQNAF